MDRRRRLVVVGVAMMALVVAGCSGGAREASVDAVPTVQVLAATEVPIAISTPAPTATAVPEATAEPTATPIVIPTPASIPTLIPEDDFVVMASNEIEEVEDVHVRFMTELFGQDESTPEGVERFIELTYELTALDQTELMLVRLAERQARGDYIVGPGFDSNPGAINADPTANIVEVLDCSRDRSTMFDAHGQAIGISSDDFEKRSTRLRKVNDRWAIVAFIVDWDEACEP